MNYLEQYEKYQNIFEEYLENFVKNLTGHEKLVKAMAYSLQCGGKRVRPVLLLATCDMFGGDVYSALPYALAVECVHTYSLIHDDLPAMDNDDIRRGKPTNHKVFGEDFAILAGDALLNIAFEICLENARTEKEILAVKCLANSSGYRGMVGGQAYDINPILGGGEEQLLAIDIGKTSKLISAPLKMSALIYGNNAEKLEAFGEKVGIIYQFVDDLLDAVGDATVMGKAVRKDFDNNKVSAVSVYGVYGTQNKIEEMRIEAEKLLADFENNWFLLEFLNRSTERVKQNAT